MERKIDPRMSNVQIKTYQPPAIEVIEMEMEDAVLSGMSSSVIEDF